MWVGIVSLFPELVHAVTSYGVLGRAVERQIVDLEMIDPRAFTSDRHQSVDDRPYGGGPGMVMLTAPLLAAVATARERFAERTAGMSGQVPVIYLSPGGETLDQQLAAELAAGPGMILIAGRYEGVDERFIETAVDREISIGDYVVSGGELPALVLLDAVARLLPGTLGNSASAALESHLDGLLDYPHYTRPEKQAGEVPAVLLSGDHAAIAAWRRQQALLRTWQRRPDMLAGRRLSKQDRELLAAALASQDTDDGKT